MSDRPHTMTIKPHTWEDLSADELRAMLTGVFGALRNPNLSPSEKVTALLLVEMSRTAERDADGFFPVDEAELARLVGRD